MGIACPDCGNITDVDFGMAQCNSCNGVFYVNLDGTTTKSSEQESQELGSAKVSENTNGVQNWGAAAAEPGNPIAQFVDASNAEPVPPTSTFDEEDQQNYAVEPNEWTSDAPVDIPLENTQEDWDSSANEENYTAWQVEEEQVVEPVDEVEASIGELQEWEVGTEGQEDESTFDDSGVTQSGESEELSSQIVEEEEPELEDSENIRPINTKKAFLEDVIDFANSDASAAREGIIQYKILIQGIDTSVEKNLLREVLNDRKLLLSVEDILSEIDNGKLEIKGLNPIKASIIVSSLHNTGIRVRWSQNAINE